MFTLDLLLRALAACAIVVIVVSSVRELMGRRRYDNHR